jgi:hypothetical protein
MKRIAVDIDGTLCPEGKAHDRPYQPVNERVKSLVNTAFDNGCDVTIYSARHWNDLRMTQEWLISNGVRFHRILLDKFPFDFLLDDRAGSHPEDLEEFIKQ